MVLTPCKTGDLSLLRAIVDKHPSPSEALEQRDSVGKTPLMRAIKYGNLDIVVFLLNKGVDLHATCTKQRRTCMHIAASSGHLAVAKTLLQAGAASQLEKTDRNGRTPYQVIGSRNRIDMQQLLSVALKRYIDNRQAAKDAVQPDGSKENSNKSINNDVQGMFNIWQAQSLGLDPIREERSSSDTNCSGNRKSLQRAPSGGGGLRHSIDVPSSVMEEQHGDFITSPSITSESHMLFWAANDRRGSVAYEPMYFEPPGVGGAGSVSSLENGRAVHMDEVMEKRRNCIADATKPAGRLSFDAGRRTSVDLQPDHWTASCTEDGGDDDNVLITDPVARAAAAAVSCAVQARASFESARASFDQGCVFSNEPTAYPLPHTRSHRRSVDATPYTHTTPLTLHAHHTTHTPHARGVCSATTQSMKLF